MTVSKSDTGNEKAHFAHGTNEQPQQLWDVISLQNQEMSLRPFMGMNH